jgi:hypothetical protein
MTLGITLLAGALLIVLAGLFCWARGLRTGFPIRFVAGLGAFALSVTGIILIARDSVHTNTDSARNDPVPSVPPEPISDEAQQRLANIHQESVRVFIGRLGFGSGRMLLPDINDVVKGPQSTPPSPLNDYTQLGLHPALGKSNIHPAMKEFPQMWETDADRAKGTIVRWSLNNLKLIGLSKKTDAKVYLTDRAPSMTERDNIPTRDLNEFERAGLEKLQAGKSVCIENQGQKVRMLGPIYVGASCISCHDQRGQMLGAFTYELERKVVDRTFTDEVLP